MELQQIQIHLFIPDQIQIEDVINYIVLTLKSSISQKRVLYCLLLVILVYFISVNLISRNRHLYPVQFDFTERKFILN